MSAKKILLNQATVQGWTQATTLSTTVANFIDEHDDLKHSFIEYLQSKVKEEHLEDN